MSLPPELQSALLGRRVVFLRGRLDGANANSVIAQLLLIARTGGGRALELYVDSPGGDLDAALSVYDVMHSLGTPVSTTGLATTGGAAVLVLAGGSPGLRFALPHARIHLVEETLSAPTGAAASDLQQIATLRARWHAALSQHVGPSAAQLDRDLAATRWLSAAEARDYGIVDGIIPGAPLA